LCNLRQQQKLASYALKHTKNQVVVRQQQWFFITTMMQQSNRNPKHAKQKYALVRPNKEQFKVRSASQRWKTGTFDKLFVQSVSLVSWPEKCEVFFNVLLLCKSPAARDVVKLEIFSLRTVKYQ